MFARILGFVFIAITFYCSYQGGPLIWLGAVFSWVFAVIAVIGILIIPKDQPTKCTIWEFFFSLFTIAIYGLIMISLGTMAAYIPAAIYLCLSGWILQTRYTTEWD